MRGVVRLPHGVNPKTFPVSVREYVECDYLHKLTPAERQWLAEFNDKWHGACFEPTDHDKGCTCEDCEDRRAAYRRKNAANNDVYAISRISGLAVSTTLVSGSAKDFPETLAAEENVDQSVAPAYLYSDEYKEAVAHVRDLLPRNPRNKVMDSPRLRAAYSALEETGGKEGEGMKVTREAPAQEDKVVETLGFEQTAKGWVVIVVRSQGNRVLAKDVVSEPAGKHVAVELLKINVSKRLILGMKD